MLKILVRLYLVIIVAYAGALLFIPDTIVGLFRDRFMAYNLDQAKGVQALIVRQFRQAPREQWPAVAQELASDFAPLELQLLRMDQAGLSDEEQARLEHGLYAVRIAEWGYYETVLAPLDKEWLVRLHSPPDPLDINVLSWGTVLIGAAMLGCLLLWVWPHWRDLERHVNQQRELLNAVSHELRTPLTRLDFGLVLLFDEVPPASRKRLLELVGHVRELDELVLELLSYSRLYNADQARERVEVSLLELVDSVLGGFAEELDGRGIRWEVQAEGNLPRFVLDPRLTARAVQNLVRNAMRYCDESLLLRLRLEGDGACLLTVEDDGIGIPVEERERIFQPFYRLDRSRDRNTGGFGLGLAISRRAIEGQGGTLTVAQSALGGAQFRIRLPAG